ncbi:hypothetical protein [Kineosporia succinea]|uniref:LPXTG-motif cell wall-anchored protein n=1 Tax=Kineosporia succinea TaxID=84632 RepID=A0ABT9P3J8_9ACTN|nr:hypothetical protein [Kineosporia succinea]MDP9827263.1 hypothetical protein [Kineosporia succinea]
MSDQTFDDDETTRRVTGTPVAHTEPLPAGDPQPTTALEAPGNPPVPESPAFRPENESLSPEPGFVGYITKKQGPEVPPAPEPPHHAPPAPQVPPAPVGHPGVRTHTVIVGLILLAIGITAITSQFSGVAINPAAVAFAVMLAAGVTLLGAALKRTTRK